MGAPTPLPPHRIDTPRLVLRVCRPDEAPLLRAAIDTSLEHLRAWMPWAMSEPSTLGETVARLERRAMEFSRGDDFSYSIFDRAEAEILGGIGLHRRGAVGCLEMGYWIRADRVNRGLATEAARALVDEALRLAHVERVQIDCDPENRPSRRIPEKLGFELVERRKANTSNPAGEPRDTLVYQRS